MKKDLISRQGPVPPRRTTSLFTDTELFLDKADAIMRDYTFSNWRQAKKYIVDHVKIKGMTEKQKTRIVHKHKFKNNNHDGLYMRLKTFGIDEDYKNVIPPKKTPIPKRRRKLLNARLDRLTDNYVWKDWREDDFGNIIQ